MCRGYNVKTFDKKCFIFPVSFTHRPIPMSMHFLLLTCVQEDAENVLQHLCISFTCHHGLILVRRPRFGSHLCRLYLPFLIVLLFIFSLIYYSSNNGGEERFSLCAHLYLHAMSLDCIRPVYLCGYFVFIFLCFCLP